MSAVPIMDDPLGKYWEQPADIRNAPIDDTTALLSSRQFAELHEYSSTFPSGVYPGKCWKRIEKNRDGSIHRTLLVWYGDENADHQCPILFRDIEIVEPLALETHHEQ